MATTSDMTAFNDVLDQIETFRNLGCPDNINPKDPTPPAPEQEAWAKEVEEKQLRAAWKTTNKAFDEWRNNPDIWNGATAPEADSGYHETIQKALKFSSDFMGYPWRTAFQTWAMNSPKMPKLLAQYTRSPAFLRTTPKEAEQATKAFYGSFYDQFRAEMLEAFGQDMKAKGNSRIFNGPQNNTYATQLSDGTWETLSEDKVADLLRCQDAGGPHVVITANHAYMEKLGDLSKITEGYTKLVKDVTKGEAKLASYKQQPLRADQTIVIAAVSTRENNFLNLAQLFARLHEIHEANVKGPATDKFIHTAPIAKMMVSTILKSIVEDPSRIKLNDKTHPPSFVTGSAPVKLRPDAAEIVRKAIFFGFSKGGNDFRDGMRLLARTLCPKEKTVGGVKVPDEAASTFKPSSDTTLKDIMSNISVTVQSLNEKPLHPYYKDRGVSVTYFSNSHDTIALAPDFAHDERSDGNVVYAGRKSDSGHHPDVITENLSHPYILQHHRCVLAGTTGKPAIRFLLHEKRMVDGKPEHALVLKTAAGTTDAMMERAIPTLEDGFRKKGLGGVHVRKIPDTHGAIRYELYSKDGIDHLLSIETIRKLTDAFDTMRFAPDNGIVISSAITDPCLPTLGKDVLGAKFRSSEGVDWKDNLVITGGDVYDRRIAQINEFMGEGPDGKPLASLHLPLDRMPQMNAADAGASRGIF